MNCILTAINAKYAHTNPAIRSLKKAAEGIANIYLKEYTINMTLGKIMADLYDPHAFVYGFSVYIWNIELVLKIVQGLKRLNPKAVILLGGPEVSYEYEALMQENPWVDYIIAGEGELAFPRFLDYLNGGKELSEVPSLVYRNGLDIQMNTKAPLCDLNALPFIYDDLSSLSRRVLYYESSRGCPYHCAFCLSSVSEKVRFRDTALVKQDIDAFIGAKAMKVKFVDRTFNADKQRAKEIFQYVIDQDCDTGFHFEISAALLDDETISILKNSPPGRIQLEAGIQSVHEQTLVAIQRKDNFEKLKVNLLKIIQSGNIHTHVDLIAGLPHESYSDFKYSFDSVFSIKADNLQLGFLKLLKGSGLREKTRDFGIEYMPFAPYTVLQTDAISFTELNQLHEIEDLLQKYYNSGLFKYTVCYLVSVRQSAFQFFEELNEYILSVQPEGEIKQSDLARLLFDFAASFADLRILKDLMRYDLFKGKTKAPIPEFLTEAKDAVYEKEFFAGNTQYSRRNTRISFFSIDLNELQKTGRIAASPSVWLFDYIRNNKIRLSLL